MMDRLLSRQHIAREYEVNKVTRESRLYNDTKNEDKETNPKEETYTQIDAHAQAKILKNIISQD